MKNNEWMERSYRFCTGFIISDSNLKGKCKNISWRIDETNLEGIILDEFISCY